MILEPLASIKDLGRCVAVLVVVLGYFGKGVAAQTTEPAIYHDGWIDLNKNGKKDIYEDSSLPIEQRIDT